MSQMLPYALRFHNEGLNPIPVVYMDKRPALATWEEYHTRISTEAEIHHWFGNGHQYNIGLVHCRLAAGDYYISIDIDHDQGLLESLKHLFPYLFTGRLEQSGSGEGYHIPLRIDRLPDFGIDTKHNRPRGNRTWKTSLGVCNCRIANCQTVVPPSVHPSGNLYRFLQDGNLAHLPDLDSLIEWLDKMAPQPQRVIRRQTSVTTAVGDNLLDLVKSAWPDCLTVFDYFNMVNEVKQDNGGEWRLLGNGGLLLTEDKQQWFCFSDEVGGDQIEAWGYCRMGSAFDRKRQFRQVLLEMAMAGGIDIATHWRPGDEKFVSRPAAEMTWTRKFGRGWGRVADEVVF